MGEVAKSYLMVFPGQSDLYVWDRWAGIPKDARVPRMRFSRKGRTKRLVTVLAAFEHHGPLTEKQEEALALLVALQIKLWERMAAPFRAPAGRGPGSQGNSLGPPLRKRKNPAQPRPIRRARTPRRP